MSIREYNKNHFPANNAPEVAIKPAVDSGPEKPDESLQFWTKHPDAPSHVDLVPFAVGAQTRPPGGSWTGPFSGRPRLIEEMAPVIRELYEYTTPSTITQLFVALRTWWRLFDDIEKQAEENGLQIERLETVTQITDLHRLRAHECGMDRLPFTNFMRVANATRVVLGRPQFYWDAPTRPEPDRHLPPKWQVDRVRFELKHAWFQTLRRWEAADELLNGKPPRNAEEARLLKNYRRFKRTMLTAQHPKPGGNKLNPRLRPATFCSRGYLVADMLRGYYPDAYDIRYAFHLCMANSGWNASVFLQLDIEKDFLEPNPKDPTRYLLRGNKRRAGDEEVVTEGLFKSQGSTGVVIQTLIQRTAPLRAQLRKDLAEVKNEFARRRTEGAPPSEINTIKKKINSLEQGVRSPWIYAAAGRGGITWLDRDSYHRGLSKGRDESNFIKEIIERINEKQPPDRKLDGFNPSDFRDAFAAYAYHVSGGSILFVMKALGHKSPKSTQIYLNNSTLNEESDMLYRTFSNSLWDEIETHGRADPTILAKRCQDGSVSAEERQRLLDYRTLRRSRMGIGCKDPTNPPKRIAPDFVPNGRDMCTTHRCTLCLERAVIFPDSLSGLCKRLVELRILKEQMSIEAYIQSSFAEEMENTELALTYFDKTEVDEQVTYWEKQVRDGRHRVQNFEGS